MSPMDAKLETDAAYTAATAAPDCAAHEPESAWTHAERAQAHAQAWSNGKMLCIFSRPADLDPWLLGRTRTLHPGIASTDNQLGAALRTALEHSRLRARMLAQVALPELDRRERRIRYLRWLLALMERHHCRSTRSFLLRMQCCRIVRDDEGILIVPSRHRRIDGWASLPRESVLALPPDSGNAELGAALREGFARCFDDYGSGRGAR